MESAAITRTSMDEAGLKDMLDGMMISLKQEIKMEMKSELRESEDAVTNLTATVTRLSGEMESMEEEIKVLRVEISYIPMGMLTMEKKIARMEDHLQQTDEFARKTIREVDQLKALKVEMALMKEKMDVQEAGLKVRDGYALDVEDVRLVKAELLTLVEMTTDSVPKAVLTMEKKLARVENHLQQTDEFARKTTREVDQLKALKVEMMVLKEKMDVQEASLKLRDEYGSDLEEVRLVKAELQALVEMTSLRAADLEAMRATVESVLDESRNLNSVSKGVLTMEKKLARVENHLQQTDEFARKTEREVDHLKALKVDVVVLKEKMDVQEASLKLRDEYVSDLEEVRSVKAQLETLVVVTSQRDKDLKDANVTFESVLAESNGIKYIVSNVHATENKLSRMEDSLQKTNEFARKTDRVVDQLLALKLMVESLNEKSDDQEVSLKTTVESRSKHVRLGHSRRHSAPFGSIRGPKKGIEKTPATVEAPQPSTRASVAVLPPFARPSSDNDTMRKVSGVEMWFTSGWNEAMNTKSVSSVEFQEESSLF